MKKNARGLYQKQITVIGADGKKKQKAFYGKTVAEINQKLLAYKGEAAAGRTFEAVANEWWDEHTKTVTERTRGTYKAPYGRLVEKFGKRRIIDIDINDVGAYIAKFSANRASKTVSNEILVINLIFSHAVRHRDIPTNFVRDIKTPRNLAKSHREPPTDAEIEKIKQSKSDFALFAVCAMYTGCRRGELLALQWGDIDFEEKVIHITKSQYYMNAACHIKKPKTEAGVRDISLLEPLEVKLRPLTGKAEEYIFTYKGELIRGSTFTLLWKRFCEETGISITPHQLRHYYATRLYDLGIDPKSAQDLLGHADFATTQSIYTHLSQRKKKETATKLKDF